MSDINDYYRKNHLYESHRIIYPQARKNWQQGNKPKASIPNFTEEEIQEMENRIKFAIKHDFPLFISYIGNNGQPTSTWAEKVAVKPGVIIAISGEERKEIGFNRITGIRLG